MGVNFEEKKEKPFYLMHKNEYVAALYIDLNLGEIVSVGGKVEPELLPLGGNLSKDSLKKWWKRRAIPKRKGTEKILNLLSIESTSSLLLANLGLSLTDHYWIKPFDSEFFWEDINLYENNFNDKIGDYFLSKDIDTIENLNNNYSPGASSQGLLSKKWIIDDSGKRCLIKGNYGGGCQQSLNEVLASEIHLMQNSFSFSNYSLTTLDYKDNKSIGCICENFTNKNLEFISAYDICASEKKPNDISEYEFFISLCGKKGLKQEYVRSFLEYQIVSDFIITNTDRHFNNFGILRDSNTLRFVEMAPIFDSGNSMFWDMNVIPKNYNFLNIPVVSFKNKETELLNYVKNKEIIKLNNLPKNDFLENLYSQDKTMGKEHVKSIIKAYVYKKEIVEMLQQGIEIGI